MLKISNLQKRYGDKVVIENFNFELKPKTIFGLVGINGAGKSTLLRLIAGVVVPDNGEIIFDNTDVLSNPEGKKHMFFLSDDPYYTMNTKIRNLVALYESIYDFDLEKFKNMINYFNLKEDKPINSFSKGMRRQLYISLAIACRPKLLLLDEAFDGLDPKARLVFKRELINLVENEETAIIISSHSLRELEAISDSFGILEDGKFTTSGNINEELERINKYQLGFLNEVNETLFKELNPLNIQILGRVVKLVLKGSIEDNKEKLRKLNPIFVDIIPIDFEELFIYEAEGKGDLK